MAHQLLRPPPLTDATTAPPPNMKLLCSFGGQILPRPGDGALRYAGGHTRLISLPRSVTFPDLILRLTDACASTVPIILKYQLPGEDLDALVSVSCAEDLANMVDEFDKIAESHTASPKLRAFLFDPGEDVDNTIQVQNYLDAVNGICRSSSGSAAEENAVEGTSPVSVPWPEQPPSTTPCVISTPTTTPYVFPTQILPTGYRPGMMVGVPSLINQVPFVTSQPYLPLAVSTAVAAAVDTKTTGLENCFMCQKALPHAHSDTVVQQLGIESSVGAPVFHTFHSEVAAKMAAAPMVTGALSKNWVNAVAPVEDWAAMSLPPVTGVATGAPVNNWVDGGSVAHGLNPFPQYEKVRIRPMIDNYDVAGVPSSIGLLGNLPKQMQQGVKPWQNVGSFRHRVSQEMITNPFSIDAGVVLPASSFVNLPQHHLGHLQQEEVIQKVGAPRYPVKEEVITNPFSVDAGVVIPPCSMGLLSNLQRQYPDPLQKQKHQWQNVGSLQYHGDHEVAVNPFGIDANFARIGHLQVSQPSECLYSYIKPRDIIDQPWKIVSKPSSPAMTDANGSNHGPQTVANSGIVTEENFRNPIVQLPPTSMCDPRILNLGHAGIGQVSNTAANYGPYPPNLGVSIVPPSSNGWFLEMPAGGTDLAYNDRIINTAPNKVWKGETFQMRDNHIPDQSSASQDGNAMFPLSNTTSPTKNVLEVSVSSSSLFSNEDPWKVLGGAYLPPLQHKENRTDSNIISLLEEGTLRHSKDHLNKALNPEPLHHPKEENILQDLQAVGERVAAPVLESFEPLRTMYEHDRGVDKEKEVTHDNKKLCGAAPRLDKKIEDIKLSHTREGIERLQLIKNSDLEELRELGSGTFGTVYHGKWRVSDVAIKRISNGCFAGRASEEERMRADFWNEARQLADLHHPNVVAFYGVVLNGHGESIATVTEYMVNGSLRTALQRSKKVFDMRKRLLIAMDVAFGILNDLYARDAIFYSYTRHINGFAANLEEDEVQEITRHPQVVSVFQNEANQLHTTRSWDLLELEVNGTVPESSLWTKASFGEDTIIATLDTGVWPESKSFDDEGMGPVPSRWKGSCPDNTEDGVRCNRSFLFFFYNS